MSQRDRISWGAVLVLLAGCRPSVDVSTEAQKLLEIDRAWAAVAGAGQNVDSIVSFWTDDAKVAQPGQPTVEGKTAIKGMVTSMLAIPGFHVTWNPESAVVSSSGDLGYTSGTNAFTSTDATGKLVTEKGRYLTVWRKQADGRWRCVMDFGNSGPSQ